MSPTIVTAIHDLATASRETRAHATQAHMLRVAARRMSSAAAATAAAAAAPATMRLPRIDDFHLHLRDGESMAALVKEMPRTVARAIVMPNLKPPVTTTADALAYRDRILAALPAGSDFTPLMTLYLTDRTTPEEITRAAASGHVYAVKLYPAGATTNSDAGVTDITRTYPALARMAEIGMPLLIHGEVTDASVDIFEREPVFLDRLLKPLVAAHPTLKVVLEHITTKEAVAFVEAAGPNVAATITAHHLLYNRNGASARCACAPSPRVVTSWARALAAHCDHHLAAAHLPVAHPHPTPACLPACLQRCLRAASGPTGTACPS